MQVRVESARATVGGSSSSWPASSWSRRPSVLLLACSILKFLAGLFQSLARLLDRLPGSFDDLGGSLSDLFFDRLLGGALDFFPRLFDGFAGLFQGLA